MAGPEFGPSQLRQTVIIVRALYGLKFSGGAWHAALAEAINSMGFQATLTDPDVWYHATSKENGFEYYEYLIVYVDDIRVLYHKAEEVMATIKNYIDLTTPTVPHEHILKLQF